MKKLVRTIAMLLFISPVFFSCESLTGDLNDITTKSPDVINVESEGGEDDGDIPPAG